MGIDLELVIGVVYVFRFWVSEGYVGWYRERIGRELEMVLVGGWWGNDIEGLRWGYE
jgi:hypothetical protein